MIKNAFNLSLGTHPLTPELHRETPRQTPCSEVNASQIINTIEVNF
jgi:hypothetical protein